MVAAEGGGTGDVAVVRRVVVVDLGVGFVGAPRAALWGMGGRGRGMERVRLLCRGRAKPPMNAWRA